MSYNISNWSTKKLDGLLIPFRALEGLDKPSFNLGTGELRWEGDLAEGFELVGKSHGEELAVSSIRMYGEGSGHAFDRLEAILKDSTGVLIASLVWEGGDSISRLTVKDGVVKHEDIEI